jgi:hypothetical protein
VDKFHRLALPEKRRAGLKPDQALCFLQRLADAQKDAAFSSGPIGKTL